MDVRLRALIDAPYAFAATIDRVAEYPDDLWERRAIDGSAGPSQATFVADDGEQFVALAVGITEEDETSVYSVWTDPAWRRRGLGAELMGSLADWAIASGSRALRLWVADSNPAATYLYESMGFEATGETQLMPSNPDIQELEYVLRLGQPSRSSTV
jgi:predicted GNAT family acetyltransferase